MRVATRLLSVRFRRALILRQAKTAFALITVVSVLRLYVAWTPAAMLRNTVATGGAVPKQLVVCRTAALKSRMDSSRARSCQVCREIVAICQLVRQTGGRTHAVKSCLMIPVESPCDRACTPLPCRVLSQRLQSGVFFSITM